MECRLVNDHVFVHVSSVNLDQQKQVLQEALSYKKSIELELDEQIKFNAMFLQLLAIFIDSAQQQKLSVRWFTIPDIFIDAAREMGLEKNLQLVEAK